MNLHTSTMRQDRTGSGFDRTVKAVAAGLALVLVLVLCVLAASPSLHQRFRTDSDHSGHFCIVCAFAGGQIDVADKTPVVATACVFVLCGALTAGTPLVSLFDFSFSPSRAPPRL